MFGSCPKQYFFFRLQNFQITHDFYFNQIWWIHGPDLLEIDKGFDVWIPLWILDKDVSYITSQAAKYKEDADDIHFYIQHCRLCHKQDVWKSKKSNAE